MIDYTSIEKQFECVDHVTSLRYLLTANGMKQYRYQCLKCGETVGKGAIKHTDLSAEQRNAATQYDETLQQERRAERSRLMKAAYQAERTERDLSWWQQYNEYMLSPEWSAKRRLVLDRDNHRCTARMKGCEAVADQVHHLTYDNAFNEPLFDLTSVCRHCHETITRLDRERKQR